MNKDTVQRLIKCLGEPDAKFAKKAVNYYDGKQVKEVIETLNSSNSFRKNWNKKGAIPRVRNITKAIVDKSGLLFNGNQPRVEVWTNGEVNQVASQNLVDILDSTDWIEFFTNFDNQVRLLKTGLVLVQQNPITKMPILDALHRGNCAVAIDPMTRQITDLLVLTSDEDEDEYRYFTVDTIYDLEFEELGKEIAIKAQFDNPYGIIPVASFHDTATPRYGMWNIAPTDLVGMNEAYNLHLMDSEYAASWSKLKTLFTDAEIEGNTQTTETWFDPETGTPRQVPSAPSIVGGPGSVVQISSGTGTTPFLEYKGPDVTLMPIEEMFSQWVKDFAGDWAVRLQASGDASASSGFQLIVEELPNMELRKQRQKMFQAGFARLYKVLTFVTAGLPGAALPQDGILYVTFQEPELPVDSMDAENVWSKKIMEGRASRVDYFMETEGMTKEEALAKITEIDLYNAPMATPNQTLTRNTAVRIA